MAAKLFLSGALSTAMILSTGLAFGQAATGSLDNFDCVNDTGETAEGFEIDIEDIAPGDLTREFPSNFGGQEYVNRFGIPTVAAGVAADGHRMVSIVWSAAWDSALGKWTAKFGSYVYNGVPERDGVAYVAKPAATQGDSCWLLGQGTGYVTSGCDHFGLSFAPGVAIGKQTYHWLVPDPANPGHLTQATWTSKSGPLPPAPVQVYVPAAQAGQPPVIHAVVEAAPPPEPGEPQWGDPRWVKTYTAVVANAQQLDGLQKNLIPLKNAKGVHVTVTWNLLQQPPGGAGGEKAEVDDDQIPASKAAVVKRYEYYAFTGAIDSETHEAFCSPLDNNGVTDCGKGPRNYTGTDPVSGATTKYVEKGKFLGAHMEAYNIK